MNKSFMEKTFNIDILPQDSRPVLLYSNWKEL